MAFTERSEATRTAILVATRKLLAERGYEGTTIRAVASLVGVDPAMVMRYYGSKDGLFEAAVDPDLYLDEIPLTPRNRLGEAVVRHFLSRWEGELSDEVVVLLLRSASTNPAAAMRMRTIFDKQVTKFVSRATMAGRAEALRRAGMMTTQLLGLAMTRYVVELPAVTKMDAEAVVETLGPVLQHYLTGNLGGAVRRGTR